MLSILSHPHTPPSMYNPPPSLSLLPSPSDPRPPASAPILPYPPPSPPQPVTSTSLLSSHKRTPQAPDISRHNPSPFDMVLHSTWGACAAAHPRQDKARQWHVTGQCNVQVRHPQCTVEAGAEARRCIYIRIHIHIHILYCTAVHAVSKGFPLRPASGLCHTCIRDMTSHNITCTHLFRPCLRQYNRSVEPFGHHAIQTLDTIHPSIHSFIHSFASPTPSRPTQAPAASSPPPSSPSSASGWTGHCR